MALNRAALSAAEQAEALAQQAQDDRLLGQARVRRGVALLVLEREEEGVQVLEDTPPLLEASGDLEALRVALNNIRDFYHDRGEYDLALAATERALPIAERLGALEGIAFQKQQRGDTLFALGRWEQARQDLEQATTLLSEARLGWPGFGAPVNLGLLLLAQGHAEAGATYLQRGLVLAEQALAEALALSQAMHAPYEEAQTLYLYGLLHIQQGETQPARERLEAALAILHRLGERLYAPQIEQALAHMEPQEWQGSS